MLISEIIYLLPTTKLLAVLSACTDTVYSWTCLKNSQAQKFALSRVLLYDLSIEKVKVPLNTWKHFFTIQILLAINLFHFFSRYLQNKVITTSCSFSTYVSLFCFTSFSHLDLILEDQPPTIFVHPSINALLLSGKVLVLLLKW